MYEVRLRDRGFNLLTVLFPKETEIAPTTLWWDRRWRSAGQFELEIPLQTPYLSDLISLANYIEILNADDGSIEALYFIERVTLLTGIVTYEQNISAHINTIYAAGQGTGTLRNLVVRLNIDSITDVGRMEAFCDARDVEMDNFDLLRQRADVKLAEVQTQGTFIARGGQPVEREILVLQGRSLLLYAEKRLVLPPPGDVPGADDIVDITGDEYDEDTDSADEVMKHYVDAHLINPGDVARTVANFVNQGAIAPLDTLTFQGRFQTVLEALQEIGKLSNAGFEVVLNGAGEFEFQVVPQRDRTIDSAHPVVFRSTDVLLGISGREYRVDWDVGDLVTLEILDQQLDLTIMQVRRELRVGEPDEVTIAFDIPTADAMEQFHDAILERTKADTLAARV